MCDQLSSLLTTERVTATVIGNLFEIRRSNFRRDIAARASYENFLLFFKDSLPHKRNHASLQETDISKTLQI